MRTFKPNTKFLTDLGERMNQSIPRDLIRPQVDRIILGPAEVMDRGFCTHCEAEDLAVGFLLPGYGYVCHNCGFYLVVKGLIGELYKAEQPNDIDGTIASLIRHAQKEPANQRPLMEGSGWPQKMGPPTSTFVDYTSNPDPSPINAVPQPGFEKVTVGPAILTGGKIGVGPAIAALKNASVIKTNHGETTLNVQQSSPGEYTPTPARPPLELKEMRAYHTVPAGTVMRIPIKPTGDRVTEPVTADNYRESDNDLVRPTNVRYRKVSSGGFDTARGEFPTSPEHIIEQPKVDLSTLSPEEQDIYRGYQAGNMTIASANDVRRYEASMGDPEIIAALRAIDDSDAELVAGEEAIRHGREMRGFGDHQSFDNPSLPRDENGVARVRLTDPQAVEARKAKETGGSHFEPLKPIED